MRWCRSTSCGKKTRNVGGSLRAPQQVAQRETNSILHNNVGGPLGAPRKTNSTVGAPVILLVDNYDSFVHNLARYFQRLGQETRIVRNDAILAKTIQSDPPRAIVLSPGPCTPRLAGCSVDVVRQLTGHVPILGICLGHQAIVEALGGRVIRAPEPMHGRSSLITHDEQGPFAGVPNPLLVGRYHSLIAEAATLPDCLVVAATTGDGQIMAVRHRQHPVMGLQFHPESILTDHGYRLLAGFLKLAALETTCALPDGNDERSHGLENKGPHTRTRSLTGVTF